MADAGILGPGDRVELIDGEVLAKAPQTPAHATAVQLAREALRVAFRDGFDVRSQIPIALDQDNEPEPDIAVVAGSPRDYVDGHPSTALLIVEVAETSLGFDGGVKKALYARFGVPEYWIVDLLAHRAEVHRSPQDDGYRDQQVLTEADSIAPLARPITGVAVADLLP